MAEVCRDFRLWAKITVSNFACGEISPPRRGLGEQRFDVILTDMRMPDLDGCALYREIERRWPARAAQVVFVSGDTLASTLREFAKDTGRPVIEKPFLPSEVHRVVAEAVLRL